MRLGPIRARAAGFPFQMLNIGYWNEYPKRDIEYVRWYPCKIESLNGRQVWATDEAAGEPLAFYLHIPFCSNHCHSCFYRKFDTRQDLVRRYLRALKKEIGLYAAKTRINQGKFTCGYLGGGTPTALTTEQLDGLLTSLRNHLQIAPDAHITIETTPNEIDAPKAQMLLSHGIRRLSMGVQSFDDVLLRRIGRTHTGEKAVDAVRLLRRAGYSLINVDLMYGLPGETPESWARTIDCLLAAQVDSVSLYGFVVVPFGHLFMRIMNGKEPPCPPEPETEEFYLYAVERLLSSGFVAVSTRDFFNARDNRDFQREPGETYYLGDTPYRALVPTSTDLLRYPAHVWYHLREQVPLGAGAFGYVNNHTCLNDPDIFGYLKKVERGQLPTVAGTYVSPEEKRAASLVLGTKLLKVRTRDFASRFKADMRKVFAREIRQLEEWGLIRMTPDSLEVTYPRGWYYSDNISKMFFSRENYRLPQPAVDNINVLRYFPADTGPGKGDAGSWRQ